MASPLPSIIVVSGLPGVGKSTTAKAVAKLLPKAAHVEADALQAMVVSGIVWPGPEPASGEAERQLSLRLRNACLLARSFALDGFTAIVDDIVHGDRYLQLSVELADVDYGFVMLCPPFEHVQQRWLAMRSPFAQSWDWIDREIRENTPRDGLWLNSEALSPSETAQEILRRAAETWVTPGLSGHHHKSE